MVELTSGMQALAVGVIIILWLFIIAIYVYMALAYQSIARKLKHKHTWFAWVPILNAILILQLGGFSWAWIFVPLVGIIIGLVSMPLMILGSVIGIIGYIIYIATMIFITVLTIIAFWRIFKKAGYAGAWALLIIIPIANFIIIGIVAWQKKAYSSHKSK